MQPNSWDGVKHSDNKYVDQLLARLFDLLNASPNQIDKLMIQRLQGRGYIVELSGPWETVKHICGRLGISTSKFRRRMKRRPHPNPSDVDVGLSGRLIALRSNLQLDTFLVGRNGDVKVPKHARANLTIRIGKPSQRPRKPSKIAQLTPR